MHNTGIYVLIYWKLWILDYFFTHTEFFIVRRFSFYFIMCSVVGILFLFLFFLLLLFCRYEGVAFESNPKMFYIGMQDQVGVSGRLGDGIIEWLRRVLCSSLLCSELIFILSNFTRLICYWQHHHHNEIVSFLINGIFFLFCLFML